MSVDLSDICEGPPLTLQSIENQDKEHNEESDLDIRRFANFCAACRADERQLVSRYSFRRNSDFVNKPAAPRQQGDFALGPPIAFVREGQAVQGEGFDMQEMMAHVIMRDALKEKTKMESETFYKLRQWGISAPAIVLQMVKLGRYQERDASVEQFCKDWHSMGRFFWHQDSAKNAALLCTIAAIQRRLNFLERLKLKEDAIRELEDEVKGLCLPTEDGPEFVRIRRALELGELLLDATGEGRVLCRGLESAFKERP